MFRLSQKEWNDMRSQTVTSCEQVTENQFDGSSQIVISSNKSNLKLQSVTSTWGGTRKLPYAFTEHGITMLASILRSDTAIKMKIAIVRAFVALRKFAVQYADLLKQIKELDYRVGNHDAQLSDIYEAIENLLDDKVDKDLSQQVWKTRERIGFKK